MIGRLSRLSTKLPCRLFSSMPKADLASNEVDFVSRDFEEMKRIDLRLQYDSAYLKIMDKWQRPLAKKRKRQQRIEEIKAEFVYLI